MSGKKTCKYIAVGVDISPSMGAKLLGKGKSAQSFLDAVNARISSFVSEFTGRNTEEKDSQDEEYSLVLFSCGDDVKASDVITKCDSEIKFSPAEGGTSKITKALSAMKDKLQSCSGITAMAGNDYLGYCVFITDGIIDSGESYAEVKKAVDELEDTLQYSFCVGFRSESGEAGLGCLLDSFTNKRLTSYKSAEEFDERLRTIADTIIKAVKPEDGYGNGEL